MKLLFDENLSPRLPANLNGLFPGSLHVHQCALGSAEDEGIWEFAKANGFTIVSKDSDFHDRSALYGSPPKVIWLRAVNCSTAEIGAVLRKSAAAIQAFDHSGDESLVIVRPSANPARGR
jgi:predicted nuclease of predicted toxin-antitoxin system